MLRGHYGPESLSDAGKSLVLLEGDDPGVYPRSAFNHVSNFPHFGRTLCQLSRTTMSRNDEVAEEVSDCFERRSSEAKRKVA